MENGTSLDDIFGGGSNEQTEPAETIGQPRDEHGRFAPTNTGEEQQQAEPQADAQEGPPPSEQEPSHIPIAALKDERTKRQQAEQERQAALERLQQYEAYFQQQQQPEEDPDPIALIAQQVQASLQPQYEMQIRKTQVEFAEQLARQKWDDYDEKAEVFKQAAANNPFLLHEFQNAANPVEYAYNAAGRILEAKSYGTAPSREQMEAEMRAKIMAELGMSNQPKAPTTLANERSIGARSGPAWSGPTPVGDIFGR